MKTDETQINIILKKVFKDQLKKIARQRAIEKDYDVSYLDLIKEQIIKLIEISGSL